jgi:release factor glutamine methyltransferase
VLIPRPETELLVELAVELEPASVIDVGTGSGAVALAVAEELPSCPVVGTDTSPGAVVVAAANAERLGLAERVAFEAGSLPDRPEADLLVANLPYVRNSEWRALQPEITRFEPRAALVGGEDGLGPIRSLAGCLSPVGGDGLIRAAVVGLEVGIDQAEDVAGLLEAAGFMHTEIRRDLAGLERVVVGR